MGILRARLLRRLAAERPLRSAAALLPDGARAGRRVHERSLEGDGRRRRRGARRVGEPQQPIDGARQRVRPGAGRGAGPAAGPGRRTASGTGCCPSTWGSRRQVFADALASRGSLIAAVEALRGAPRTLDALPIPADPDAAVAGRPPAPAATPGVPGRAGLRSRAPGRGSAGRDLRAHRAADAGAPVAARVGGAGRRAAGGGRRLAVHAAARVDAHRADHRAVAAHRRAAGDAGLGAGRLPGGRSHLLPDHRAAGGDGPGVPAAARDRAIA